MIKMSIDKVYNAKNIFWIARLYRKKGRKITVDFTELNVILFERGCQFEISVIQLHKTVFT
jgi:hypothetical protein